MTLRRKLLLVALCTLALPVAGWLYVRQMETGFTQRIRDLLEPVVGKDNLRAQVTADLDFSQIESTAEEFKPNQTPTSAAVRSQQTSESSNGAGGANAQPTGVPGAMSNQPPTPATAPINGASQPLQGTQANGAGGAGGSSRRDAARPFYASGFAPRAKQGASPATREVAAGAEPSHDAADGRPSPPRPCASRSSPPGCC